MKKVLYIIALMALIVPSTCLLSACACSFLGANTYTVTFVDWDDTVIDEQTVNSGENAVPPANPTRTGYTFASWEGSYQNITSDRTIKAKYNINTYTVTFKDYNDAVLSTQTVEYGKGATAPATPTREGYTFTGWDKAFNNIVANIIVNAVYEEIEQPVSIVGNWKTKSLGINVTEENPEGDVILIGESLGETLLTEDYFYATFTETQATINHLGNNYVVSYSKDNDFFITEEITEFPGRYQFTLNQEGKLKVEAYLTDGLADGYILLEEGVPAIPSTFLVTFKDWDGTVLSTQTVNEGEAAVAPADPTREGYTFTGWEPADFTNVIANLTIVATYSENADNIVGTWANGRSYTSETYETTEGDISGYLFTFEEGGTLSCTLGETYSGTWVKNGENYSLSWNESSSTAIGTINEDKLRISDDSTFWWQFEKNV